MPILELEDPDTGEIIFVDTETGSQVNEGMAPSQSPALMPVPSLQEQGVREAAPLSKGPPLSWKEAAAAALMAPVQGVTLNTADELVGLLNPEAGAAMQQLYGRFQEQYPIASTGLEVVGPIGGVGVATKAAKTLGTPLLARVAQGVASPGLIPQVLKGGVAGVGAAEGSLKERLGPGMMGAGLAGGGSLIGGLVGKYLGTGKQLAQVASSPLSEAEQRLALEIANQGQSQQFTNRMAQAAQDLSPVETFGEMAGYTPAVQGIARMPEGADLVAALEARTQGRPERLQSTFAEGLGGAGKIPTELATEALQTTKAVRKEALKRQYQAGRELYSPLEVNPELTSGQSVTMGERISAPQLAKEERKFGKVIGQGEERIQNILDDVADDLGEDAANSILEPGISVAERTKRIKAISRAGYDDADILMDEFGKVDRAEWNIAAKTRLRSEVGKLTKELTPKEWQKLLPKLYLKGEAPNFSKLSLPDLKIKVLGPLRKINKRNELRGLDTYQGIEASRLQKLERDLDSGFRRIFPKIKEADYTYATKTIPEAFGGMDETARRALEEMTRVDVPKPTQIKKMGETIASLDPSQVQQIIEGSKNIGKPEMLEAMRKGYVAKIKNDIKKGDITNVMREFERSTDQRQILDILAGKEQSNKILSRLSKEEKLGRVEGQVKGGSQTAGVTLAVKDLTRLTDPSGPQNVTQRMVNMFRQPILALDALISLAPQFRDKQVKNEIYRIYGLQGQSALEKMQQLSPIIRKLEESGELRDRWMEYGARAGGKAGSIAARRMSQQTEE